MNNIVLSVASKRQLESIIASNPDKGITPLFFEKIKQEDYIMTEVMSPMGGKIIDVKVNVGDTLNEGDEVVILEAMKMELPVVANGSGTVKEVKCKKGDAVEADAVLIVLE